MKVAFELTAEQSEKLRAEVLRLGVPPDALAQAVVADLLSTADDAFDAASARVLSKNEELYKRLS
jgi:hypothetical protein